MHRFLISSIAITGLSLFELADAPAAFAAMDSGDFFGKVVIRL